MVVNHQIFVRLAVSIFNNDFLRVSRDLFTIFFLLEFCPAQCNSEEVVCSGEWNDDCPDCEKLTADYCIPSKIGDCWNSCPTHCPKDDLICPGKMNPDGCQDADFCHSGSTYHHIFKHTSQLHRFS